MTAEVIPAAPDQQPVLANLLELYGHDFNDSQNRELGPDGRFGYAPLPLYWSDPDRHPFLLRLEGKLVGFVLVKRGSEGSGDPAVWDMAEFFVLRGYRRRGLGIDAAYQVWRRFPGRWEVRVMQSNHSAHDFWERAIASFTGGQAHSTRVDKGTRCWYVFSFSSNGRSL